MRVLKIRTIAIVLTGLIAAAALVLLGRVSVDRTPAHSPAQPVDQSD
jgi:hypothetical protein